MKAAAKAGKPALAPADLRKARVQGDAGPSAPVAAPLLKEIPEVLVDKCSRRLYVRGRFLSKAGVVKCFEISDQNTKEVFAAKIVPKSLLTPSQKKKLSKEISIHRSLSHQHVVGFHSVFEDSEFVFVILELCREWSLLELHKRKKGLTQLEARYYLRQIILGCQYLHHNQVIHGNLRLSNIFLNEDMEVKIGGFRLATKVEYEEEQMKTFCSPQNFVAPEAVRLRSFEEDVWSIGCIMYTLLVGKPPFETSFEKETYLRMKPNEYSVPKHINPVAASLIQKMLQAKPTACPTIEELLKDEFFTSGYIPARLPITCLTIPPRLSVAPRGLDPSSRKPLMVLEKGKILHSEQECCRGDVLFSMCRGDKAVSATDTVFFSVIGVERPLPDHPWEKEEPVVWGTSEAIECHLSDMLQQLTRVNACKPSERRLVRQEEAEDPACIPIFWVSHWVDQSMKYGLGYQLCNNSTGALFNDSTCLVLYNDGDSLQYIDHDGTESYPTMSSHPDSLMKKITLLQHFRSYMNEHLQKAGATMTAGANTTPREGDELARLPYLKKWLRTSCAIVLHLSNGTIQINFFQDHTKLILCPMMAAVTCINKNQDFHTYSLSLLEEYGCCEELGRQLCYAHTMIDRMLSSKSPSSRLEDNT